MTRHHITHGPAKAGHYVLALALGAAMFQSPATHAQDPQGAPTVTFQVEVSYVDVDTVVTDEQGNFISGLTRNDFELLEDGKPQKIDLFSYVEIPVDKAVPFLANGRPVASDSRSNRQPFTGRLFVIVLDDFDISPLRSAHTRKSAREFVDKYMGANDIAAVIYTSGRPDGAQEFTSNKQLLGAAIDKFVGRRMRSLTIERLDSYYQRMALAGQGQTQEENGQPAASTDPGGRSKTEPSDFERSYRATAVLDTLKNTSEFLATVRGRRKAVIFFSEGIDYPITDLFGMQSASEVIRAVQDAVSMAARSNVNYYTIDPRGLVGMTSEFMEMQGGGAPELAGGPSLGVTGITGGGGVFNAQTELMHELQLSQGSLRTLAEETGGIASVNSNSLSTAFERIVQANSRYYVLGYYPPTHARDGKFHKIDVRVKGRPGLKVLARRGYASPRGRSAEERKRDEETRRTRDAKRPNADTTSPELRTVLTNPMQQSGLPLTVQVAAFKHTQKEASVALAVEIDAERLQFAPPNEKGMVSNVIEISLFSVSDQGKAMAGMRSSLDLLLRPETHDRVKAFGVRVNPRINLPPGRHHLRIGARDKVGGQTGSVFYDLEIPDFRKDKLMMGGLLVTSAMSQRAPSIQPDPIVAKLLPAAATSQREFSQQDILALYTEVYDNISSRQARRIDIAVRLVTESGTEVFVSRDDIANGGAQKSWETYGFPREIPLKGVPPGRYLLRVEAQVRGNVENAKPASRETVITVVP